MAVRIISALVGLPILLFIVSSGGLTLKISLMLIALIGIDELYKALYKKYTNIQIFGYLSCVLYIYFVDNFNTDIFIAIQTIFILCIFIYMVLFYSTTSIKDVIYAVFGFFYVPFLLANVYLLRHIEIGAYFIWLAFISAWACDTGAYFTGVKFGKHKLTPNLSPKKTIEGSIGGILLATSVGAIYGKVISNLVNGYQGVNLVFVCGIICFIGSIFAQFGDLTASAIKRYTGIKDFGKIMPGHGGVLDRFDSVMFTAPVAYLMVSLLEYL